MSEMNYCFSDELINEVSDKNGSLELMAIFEMKTMIVQPSEKTLIVICDRP